MSISKTKKTFLSRRGSVALIALSLFGGLTAGAATPSPTSAGGSLPPKMSGMSSPSTPMTDGAVLAAAAPALAADVPSSVGVSPGMASTQPLPPLAQQLGPAAPLVNMVPVKVIYVSENQPVQIVDQAGRLIQVIYLKKK